MERYQFQVDNRPAGPVRTTWRDAVQDAVNDGYAVWVRGGTAARFEATQGASVCTVDATEAALHVSKIDAQAQRIQGLEAEVERLRHDLERSVQTSAALATTNGTLHTVLSMFIAACDEITVVEFSAKLDEAYRLARNTLQDDK